MIECPVDSLPRDIFGHTRPRCSGGFGSSRHRTQVRKEHTSADAIKSQPHLHFWWYGEEAPWMHIGGGSRVFCVILSPRISFSSPTRVSA